MGRSEDSSDKEELKSVHKSKTPIEMKNTQQILGNPQREKSSFLFLFQKNCISQTQTSKSKNLRKVTLLLVARP